MPKKHLDAALAELELRVYDSQITYQPKIYKTSIFQELFFLKYIFKIISADDTCLSVCLSVCLDLNEPD